MTIRMTALKAFSYAHRSMRAGVEFSVKSERDARLLEAINRAQRVAAPAVPVPPPPKPKGGKKRVAAPLGEAPPIEPPAEQPAIEVEQPASDSDAE